MVRTQLEYILLMHTSDGEAQEITPIKEPDETEEVDHIEAELDSNDQYCGISGENFLKQYKQPIGNTEEIFLGILYI